MGVEVTKLPLSLSGVSERLCIQSLSEPGLVLNRIDELHDASVMVVVTASFGTEDVGEYVEWE